MGSFFDVMCVNIDARIHEFPRRLNTTNLPTPINVNTLLIKKYNFTSIPDDAFAQLNINNLIIGENNMKVLTVNAFRHVLSIHILRIIENQLDTIEPEALTWVNSSLVEIGMWQLNFKSPKVNSIFEELVKFRGANLKTLKIMGYNMKKFKTAWLPLVKDISSFSLASNNLAQIQSNLFTLSTQLISLDLSQNILDDMGDTLISLEPLNTILKELKLNGNQIEHCVTLSQFTTLEILDLSNNRIKYLRAQIFAQLSQLSHLYLSDNKLISIDDATFSFNTNLAVLLLSSNYLNVIPNLKTNLKLKIVDMSNQNGKLTQIENYAFERESMPINPMNINLGSNAALVKFAARSFCSRNSNTTEILALDISFESMKSFSRCLLKQLNSRISPKIVLRIGLPVENVKNYAAVCTCDLKRYALYLNVETSGACDLTYSKNNCDVVLEGKERIVESFKECQGSEFACL